MSPNNSYTRLIKKLALYLIEGVGSHTKEAVANDVSRYLGHYGTITPKQQTISFKMGVSDSDELYLKPLSTKPKSLETQLNLNGLD